MLFILHNNVVLFLFLCIFYYIFYIVFCTVYTYFLHILYIFYTYFVHFSRYFLPFLRKNNALLVHYWLNITYLSAFLTHFRAFFHQFPTIFCTFAQTLRVFLCTSVQLFALPASSFSVLLYKLFLHIALAKCHSLYKLFGTFAQTFSSLPPHFFQLVKTLWKFVSSYFTASHSFFLCDYSFFLPFRFCFYCFFHS